MNARGIKPMLTRLQCALKADDLADDLVFCPGSRDGYGTGDRSTMTNLVVGYTGSANSQIALDLTLWMAHQTRLATQAPVMVHVVYVLNNRQFEHADHVLYQARHLADEWHGSLTSHLRFGDPVQSLYQP